jgi:hypothetical protein
MSNSSRSDRTPLLAGLAGIADAVRLSRPLTGLAFWAAIALPFLHLPLLVTGLETTRMAIAFLLLLGLNVFALVIGHSYRSE